MTQRTGSTCYSRMYFNARGSGQFDSQDEIPAAEQLGSPHARFRKAHMLLFGPYEILTDQLRASEV